MRDPLSLLPYSLAAGGGSIDELEVQQLVAAGLTLLQRSAPLVRALARHRSAILLPAGAAYITALAASEGRGALLLDPASSAESIANHLRDANASVAFTIASLAHRLPPGTPHVLLDASPRSARVIIGEVTADVDLGSHFGLTLEGDPDAEGADEECVLMFEDSRLVRLTHRDVLAEARSAQHDHASSEQWFTHHGFIAAMAPLVSRST
ncbi:MAG: hypothetical protein JWO05_3477 [Gemmatimonadetes bacterium]|nr:hypothetical protein [Gemmatimonadota bacterium]